MTPAQVELTVPARSKWASIPTHKLTSEERIARNHALVALRIRRPDLTFVDLGFIYGITERRARGIWHEWRDTDRSMLTDEDPVDVIHEHIAGFRHLRAQAAVLAETTTSDSVMLGALKLVAEMRMRDIELRQETGLLPHDLGRIEIDLDIRFVVDQVVALLKKHNVPKAEIAELIAVLDGEVTPQTILEAAAPPAE
jgi:hypothetical protein